MRKTKQISGTEEFPMIYVDIPGSVSVGCAKWLPLKEGSTKREEKSNITVEKPDTTSAR